MRRTSSSSSPVISRNLPTIQTYINRHSNQVRWGVSVTGLELSISSTATAQKGLKYKPHDERLKLLGNTSPKKKIRDLIQVFRKVKGFDAVDFATFFEWDNGGGHALRGQRWKLRVNRCRPHLRCFFQSENYQYMEQVASQCRGGFLRQLLQGTTGARMRNYKRRLHPLLHKSYIFMRG